MVTLFSKVEYGTVYDDLEAFSVTFTTALQSGLNLLCIVF